MSGNYEQIRIETNFNTFHTIQEAIYESLRKAILDRRLPVGERLIEKQLAEVFCVSRTPVRQALKKLGEEGLVEFSGRQGAMVSHMTQEDIDEIFKLREAFEGLILDAAMKHLDHPTLLMLKKEIETSKERYERGQLKLVSASFEQLQKALVKTADMPRTAMMLEQMVDYLKQFRNIAVANPERCIEAIHEHERIIHAMQMYRIKDVQSQNRIHLYNAKEMMMASFAPRHSC